MLSIEEFEMLFKGCMPRINWDRAKAEQWRVAHCVVDDRKALGDWKIVVTKGGILGDGGQKISLHEVIGDMSLFGQDWRKEVFDLAAEMEGENQKIALVLPALGNTIMDGNHRSVACMLGGFEFAILILRLVHPTDPALHLSMWGEEDFA
jgi:hypothetical protein